MTTHALMVGKELGGWYDLLMYQRAFGSFALFAPERKVFAIRERVPTPDEIDRFWGNSVHFGLRALFAAAKSSGRGRKCAFRHLASQSRENLVDAQVWIAKDTFSQDAQLQPFGTGDTFGFWFPCLTMRFVDANCSAPFWCPRLALDGTKCWWAHGTRFVFVSPNSEIVDAQVPGPPEASQSDEGVPEDNDDDDKDKGVPGDNNDDDDDDKVVPGDNDDDSGLGVRGKDKGVPEDNDDDDDDASTFASSESGDSSWCDVSSCSSDFSFEAQSMLPPLPPILEDTAMADGLAAQEAAEQEDTAGLAAQEADDSFWDILD